MGTDIHMAVEVRRPDGWQAVWPTECWECYGTKRVPGRPDLECYSCRHGYEWWEERSYATFAALAGVRNGVAFAGSPTHDPLTPIAEPRGLPGDLSPELMALLRQGGSDGKHRWYWDHSPSWLLLSEVLAYRWDRTIHCVWIVDAKTYEAWSGEGSPWAWCSGISGVEIVDNAEMSRRIAGKTADGLAYTTVRWTETLAARCGRFLAWARSLPTSLDVSPDRIRLVFGFDS